MEKQISIPRSAFFVMLLALSVSLVGIAFLLGRESKSSEVPTQSAQVQALPEHEEKREEEDRSSQVLSVSNPPPIILKVKDPPAERKSRVKRAPVTRVKKAPAPPARQAVARPPTQHKKVAAAPQKTAQDSGSIRGYFSQIDSSLAGTQSLGDPNAFATELLQGSLSGDTSKFDSLIASSKRAVSKVEKIQPPPSCAEHHSLLLKQLRQGTELLAQVGGATSSLDTSSLGQISQAGAAMQAEAQRLQELERKLRARI